MSDTLAILERITAKMATVQKIEDLRRTEAALTKKMSAHFSRQGKLFLGELAKFRSRFEEAISPSEWEAAWRTAADRTQREATVIVEEGATEAWKHGAKRIVEDLGLDISFMLPNPRAVAWLEAHAAEAVAGIDDTTERYIRTLMTKAVDEGWSYNRTAKMLSDRFSQFAVGNPMAHIESRAHLVAVTEAAFAYEHANGSIAGDLVEGGLPMVKKWLTVGDSRVDSVECGPNQSQDWIPEGADFQSGDTKPPAHPGCRCTTLYQVDPDFLGPLPDVTQTDTGVQVSVGMT